MYSFVGRLLILLVPLVLRIATIVPVAVTCYLVPVAVTLTTPKAAKSVEGWATETTVMGRPQPLPSPWRKGSPSKGLRFSYHTHYVGDMRQINLNILDM